MDGWERAYRNLRLGKLDQSPVRFLLYGVTLAFWAQVSAWLLLRTELLPGVDDAGGWVVLSMLALPGNVRAIFLIALWQNPKGDRETGQDPAAQAEPPKRRRRLRFRLKDRWRRGGGSRENAPPRKDAWSVPHTGSHTPPLAAGTAIPTGPPPAAIRRGFPTSTLVKILVGITIFAVCGGFWLTGGTIVDPSDTATEPPRLRNQSEKRHMLELINQARVRNGVPPVVMGTNNVAQIQADNLLRDCVLSHWGTDGLKPYMRYSLAGGYQTNAENALTQNECGLADTWLQWNDEPMQMVRDAVDGWQESPGHRETMLNPSYRKVNIGLAWDRNTFKAVQHFEGHYVELTLLPAIRDGELTLEGRLEGEYRFDGIHPLIAFIIYDPKPRNLTQGQLARTSCYSHGEVVAAVIPPSPLLRAGHEYTDTVEGPQCADPYRTGSSAPRPETREEMDRAWTESKERSERMGETEFSVQVLKAQDLEVEGREFRLAADLEDLLDEHGPGVYTVALLAELEGVGTGELQVISEYSVFHQVRAPETYARRE